MSSKQKIRGQKRSSRKQASGSNGSSQINIIKKKMSNRSSVVSFPVFSGASNIRVPFRVFYSMASGASNTSLNITETSLTIANLGSRVIDLGDVFSQFRLISLDIISYMMSSSTTFTGDISGLHGMAVTGTNPLDYATPTTLAQLVDFPVFQVGMSMSRLEVKVPKSVLEGSTPSKWYNTSNASDDFSAGTITWFNANQANSAGISFNQHLVYAGIIELTGPIDPALVPLDRKIAIQERKLAELESLKNSLQRDPLLVSQPSLGIVSIIPTRVVSGYSTSPTTNSLRQDAHDQETKDLYSFVHVEEEKQPLGRALRSAGLGSNPYGSKTTSK
jgi:hypothetical protein